MMPGSLPRELLSRLGFQLKRIPRGSVGHSASASFYQVALQCLLGGSSRLTIVEIGANDGVTNDPIFPFVRNFPDRTRVVLVEPQKFLIPIVQENYAFHNSAHIVNAAIGAGSSLTLYSIRPEYWATLRPRYARNWPEYRAATGVTSTSRGHVEDWIRRYFPRQRELEQVIEEVHVPCSSLPKVLSKLEIHDGIDVLQVDTEGADDQVIFSCEIETTRPRVIHFEAGHLREDRTKAIMTYLRQHNYIVVLDGLDWLAIRNSP